MGRGEPIDLIGLNRALAKAMSRRPQRFKSHGSALRYFQRHPGYFQFDPDVILTFVEHALVGGPGG